MTEPEIMREAARHLLSAKYVMAMTGAGISVESGIPPFRGPGGLWTKYGEPPMNGYELFLQDPKKAWEERLSPSGPSKEMWQTLGTAEPNAGHTALVELENMGILRSMITQNVDNLHRRAAASTSLKSTAIILWCVALPATPAFQAPRCPCTSCHRNVPTVRVFSKAIPCRLASLFRKMHLSSVIAKRSCATA